MVYCSCFFSNIYIIYNIYIYIYLSIYLLVMLYLCVYPISPCTWSAWKKPVLRWRFWYLHRGKVLGRPQQFAVLRGSSDGCGWALFGKERKTKCHGWRRRDIWHRPIKGYGCRTQKGSVSRSLDFVLAPMYQVTKGPMVDHFSWPPWLEAWRNSAMDFHWHVGLPN